ncbi:SDR family NAD(P)-dependent oxidoreductase [Amycolatopsis sp. 195334CR]|uniref:SDR family NAD(P)-dependent oxidoreductase n=1 Tax=Amycolatopsis sp. 195334CR TaxID=2814588 RepID=UPI001A90527C|nr:SDR family NAD(P)-dependent oxidoreductase [Amycolatopsis sp. 195334CR]MBN6038338.1 SDR family NAD(P)-dependent oxidoreductase [Amycolatopsis sp. 195334CR]
MSRVVLVAGASSGIGRAAAVSLAGRGHRVFGSSRGWPGEPPPGVEPVTLDVTDDASVRECVDDVLHRAGRIDVLVYSAGCYVAGAAEETSPALALRQLDAYLLGAHRLVRAVLPAMRRQTAGRLIFMSSSAAVAAIPFHAVYSASKAALEGYVDAVRYEVAPFGVDATCVQGTSVRTGAADAALHAEPLDSYAIARDAVVERFATTQRDGGPPTAFARTITRAVEARRLPPRYRVGIRAKALPALRALLPDAVFRRLFARKFGLPSGK